MHFCRQGVRLSDFTTLLKETYSCHGGGGGGGGGDGGGGGGGGGGGDSSGGGGGVKQWLLNNLPGRADVAIFQQSFALRLALAPSLTQS